MVDALVSYIVPVIHVVSCLFLIVVVLLQTGKGADMSGLSSAPSPQRKLGVHSDSAWIPAFAGMTRKWNDFAAI